jgi:hypothetical protein
MLKTKRNSMAHLRELLLFGLLMTACVGFAGCAATSPVPDFSLSSDWAHLPKTPSKPVDVFYVYPTIYGDASPKNMDISRQDLRATIHQLLVTQAGVFTPSANLYAPYYRQVSFAALDSSTDMYQNPNFQIGAQDVLRAFAYYLEHYNNGRPFILAGHSQGSMALINMIRKHFNDSDLQKQLVAAYLIGYSVTAEDIREYPWFSPATGAADTGVIISYNTQSPDATDSPVLLDEPICINPLNWKTDSTPADKALNLGAVFYDNQGQLIKDVPGYCGATINPKTGALETIPPEKVDVGGFPKGVYHRFDYPFFYRNLQDNVKTRCNAYLKRQRE